MSRWEHRWEHTGDGCFPVTGSSQPAMPDHAQRARELVLHSNEIAASQWDTSDEQDYQAILSALTQAHAQGRREGLEEVIHQCQQGFVIATSPATEMGARGQGWEQLSIVEAWCRAQFEARVKEPEEERESQP